MTQQQWRFPEPGYLEGVKSKDKAILKLMHCGFTYPGTTRKVVHDASIFCSLSSRVAVVGANGESNAQPSLSLSLSLSIANNRR